MNPSSKSTRKTWKNSDPASAIIRDVASHAVYDLPASFKASAAIAQEYIKG
jgi:hypothetical protein